MSKHEIDPEHTVPYIHAVPGLPSVLAQEGLIHWCLASSRARDSRVGSLSPTPSRPCIFGDPVATATLFPASRSPVGPKLFHSSSSSSSKSLSASVSLSLNEKLGIGCCRENGPCPMERLDTGDETDPSPAACVSTLPLDETASLAGLLSVFVVRFLSFSISHCFVCPIVGSSGEKETEGAKPDRFSRAYGQHLHCTAHKRSFPCLNLPTGSTSVQSTVCTLITACAVYD